MERMQRIVKASVLYRALFALCLSPGAGGVGEQHLHPPLAAAPPGIERNL